MILTGSTILAMVEGMRRIKRTPEREWLAPIIEALERLPPGDKLTIERLKTDG